MDLKPGAKLGSYEMVSSLGRGDMGEVWKARDSQLGRDVVIRIFAQPFTGEFEVEARGIATLNHANICTLLDAGPNYLVMEFVEGATLAERLAEGPIRLEAALSIAGQIAEALEAAHEKGIVHRDLNPGRVRIRPDGSVKVLEFGLATLMAAAGSMLDNSGYLAPEQARGKMVDKRADIWAFGVILYEMTTNQRLFDAGTISDSLAAMIQAKPDLQLAPLEVRLLLRRCLEKDPKRRLRDIGDAMPLVEDIEPLSAVPSRSRLGMAGWFVAALATLAAAAVSFVHFQG